MFGLRRKQRPLLGIDISSTAIKLIELASTPDTADEFYRVETFAIEPLPANAVVENKLADVESVGQIIARAVSRSGTRAKRTAVAVSGSAVITKVIAMNAALSDAEMEAQIQLEADQYIPYPLEEVNLDFDVLGPTAGNTEMVDVLLAASRRENVDDRVSALEIAGLVAEIVDVEAYAMENACGLLLGGIGNDIREQTVAVVDIGATTSLQVLHAGRTVYTREQNFGGNQLVEEVQRRYTLSLEQALERIETDKLPENYHIEVLGPYQEALAQQIARALQFFYSASSFNRADHIILAGGAASIPHIDALIEERLGFPVAIANPFEQMAIGPRVNQATLQRAAPSLMVAVGLALRSFG
ncbi:MAG: pilus assembly protein PilM [Chromatiaceae bacterium]|nr:MAG: pilus assembly protein PilM [Chromatiaceae bacterium]